MNVYISNLSHAEISGDLRTAFEAHGTVASVTIITDEFNGKKRGFGIIEMPDENEAKSAITALEGATVAGHNLHLTDRRNKPSRRANRDRRNYEDRKRLGDRRNAAERRASSN